MLCFFIMDDSNSKDESSKCFSYIATKVTYDPIQSTTNTLTVTNVDSVLVTTSDDDVIPDASHQINKRESNDPEDEFMQEAFKEFDFDSGTTLDDLIG